MAQFVGTATNDLTRVRSCRRLHRSAIPARPWRIDADQRSLALFVGVGAPTQAACVNAYAYPFPLYPIDPGDVASFRRLSRALSVTRTPRGRLRRRWRGRFVLAESAPRNLLSGRFQRDRGGAVGSLRSPSLTASFSQSGSVHLLHVDAAVHRTRFGSRIGFEGGRDDGADLGPFEERSALPTRS